VESNKTIIQPSEFTNFLESGAVLRASANTWFLLMGPFQRVPEVAFGQIALYTPDFFAGPTQSYWLPHKTFQLNDQDLQSLCDLSPECEPPVDIQWQAADLQSFQQAFREIQSRIHAGPLKKAVPIVFEKAPQIVNPARIRGMLKHLLNAPPSLFVYGFWQDGKGTLGATPEVLLRQNGVQLRTMALAGTSPKNAHGRTDLLADPKELYEHDLVVQDIESSLAEYGDVHLRGPELLELPSLLHLKTEIQCQLRKPEEFLFFEACTRLHPTPALGVSPRSYGYEWMKELPEQSLRGGFGAPWGLQWGPEDALCLVAIRNLQWDADGVRIGSGCGIVPQSQVTQEWQELFEKRQSVKKILGMPT
jgi:menaquinone-specific isochorismate synthase